MKDKMIKWYSDSLKKYGEKDFRSLAWGNEEGSSAKLRYEQMFSEYDWTDKKVFEIGCGWGSFFDFGFKSKNYYGIDVMSEFIELANKNHSNDNIKFETKDIFDFTYHRKFDVAISSGVAGNRGGPAWHPSYLTEFLSKMYGAAQTVIVNFPSNRATIRTDNVEYFSPEFVLGQALNITENIKLIHKNKFDFLLRLEHE